MNLWLIPFFPLIGFLLNGIFGRRITKPVVTLIAVGSVVLSSAGLSWSSPKSCRSQARIASIIFTGYKADSCRSGST